MVSVIIVNWNGLRWLKPCLDSLRNQTYKNFEIIFVDNGSFDASVAFVEKNYPEVHVVKSDTNAGFAGGTTIGLRHARGEYIFFLNNDTVAAQDCLEILLQGFQEIPNLGSIQPKIFIMHQPDRLGGCGIFLTKTFKPYLYGFRKKDSQHYNKIMPVFSNIGAAMLVKKELINTIGFFDDDFWNYYEDIDWCYRMWLAGYECWYYPKTHIYHAMGGTASVINKDTLYFHGLKNTFLTVLKNSEWTTIMYGVGVALVVSPLYLGMVALGGRWNTVAGLCRAVFWNLQNMRHTLQKRRMVQSLRKKTDTQLFTAVGRKPGIKYYYYYFTDQLERYKENR